MFVRVVLSGGLFRVLRIIRVASAEASEGFPGLLAKVRQHTILSIAKAERKKAEIKVKTLEIRFQYTPKEDSCPTVHYHVLGTLVIGT